MSANVTLVLLTGCLYAAGVFLVLERSLTRVLLGILLLGNATNVLLLTAGGPAGEPPIVGRAPTEEMGDPLAQALILTAIVITFGMAAFLLSMIYRSWQLARAGDEVEDDREDRRMASRSRAGDFGEDDDGRGPGDGSDDDDGDATDGFLPLARQDGRP